MIDYQGIAIVIGALGIAVPSIISAGLAVMSFIRQGHIETTVVATHDLVNGLSGRKDDAIERAAFAEGEKSGVATERAAPQVPATASSAASQPQPVVLADVAPAAVAAIAAVAVPKKPK